MWVVRNKLNGDLIFRELSYKGEPLKVPAGEYADLDLAGRETAEGSREVATAFSNGWITTIEKKGSRKTVRLDANVQKQPSFDMESSLRKAIALEVGKFRDEVLAAVRSGGRVAVEVMRGAVKEDRMLSDQERRLRISILEEAAAGFEVSKGLVGKPSVGPATASDRARELGEMLDNA